MTRMWQAGSALFVGASFDAILSGAAPSAPAR
jgi:hypothetical protein